MSRLLRSRTAKSIIRDMHQPRNGTAMPASAPAARLQSKNAPRLLRDGAWTADYRRLRIAGRKLPSVK